MKAIVFGGSGFVGSHFADALTAVGHAVTIFDRNPSPYLQPRQRFIQGDVLNFRQVSQAVKSHDVLYNFAGLADIFVSLTHPIETVKLNILGCVHQLEAARLHKVKRFVFASSVYVYSNAGAFYRVSKQACELYIEEYRRLHGLNYTILRFGTLYGRRADERNSVFRYLRDALLGKTLIAYGTGDELREYIHVEDAARIGVNILKEDFRNQNVIVTGHDAMRYRDLLNMIREIVGPRVKIKYRPLTPEQSLAHYSSTPYNYHPKLAKKLVSPHYLDMGQGLLDCLEEIAGKLKAAKNTSKKQDAF
jgi:UDP-glucose 4-epimerase